MSTADEPPPSAVITAKAFERDLKRLRKSGVDLEPLWIVVETIRLGHQLAVRHRDHALTGDWKGFRDCHIQPDWVMIYSVDDAAVYLTRTGTHTDLL